MSEPASRRASVAKRTGLTVFIVRIFISSLLFALMISAAPALVPALAADEKIADLRIAFQHFNDGQYERSIEIAKTLADDGDADAQHLLGHLYEKGLGVTADLARAMELYARAALHGQADAQFALGELALRGDQVKPDPARAVAWFKLAALRGHPGAKMRLGLIYAEGLGVEKDLAAAADYFEAAAASGDADAQYHLGAMHLAGEGRDQDYQKAARLFEDAANQGHARAQFNLALLADANVGAPPQDATLEDEKIVRFMRAAAENGLPDAMVAMGLLTHDGRAGKTEEIAADWFERAALTGSAQGQFLYSVSLSEGDGRAKDPDQALIWVERALANKAGLDAEMRHGAEALQRQLKAK